MDDYKKMVAQATARIDAQEILRLSTQECVCSHAIAFDPANVGPSTVEHTRRMQRCPAHGHAYLLVTVEIALGALPRNEIGAVLAATKERLGEAVSALAAGRPAEGKVRVLRGKVNLPTAGDV